MLYWVTALAVVAVTLWLGYTHKTAEAPVGERPVPVEVEPVCTGTIDHDMYLAQAAIAEAEVNDLLTSAGIDCYTKFPNALGWGRLSEPHLDTETWPGVNRGPLVVVEDDQARTVMEDVRRLRETLGPRGSRPSCGRLRKQHDLLSATYDLLFVNG